MPSDRRTKRPTWLFCLSIGVAGSCLPFAIFIWARGGPEPSWFWLVVLQIHVLNLCAGERVTQFITDLGKHLPRPSP